MANQTIGDLTPLGVVTDPTLFEVEVSSSSGSVSGADILAYITTTGVMGIATYDPAGISEQLVGLTATQTLTNKTLTAPAMTLVSVTSGTITGVTITGGSVSGLATDIAIADGGTGASDAATARANLGAGDMDTSVYDPAAIAEQVVGTTATQTLTNKSLTSPAVTGSPTAAGATWPDLGSVTTVDINGGTINGITDLAVVDGGTGASTAADARDNLGVTIGVDVQAFDAANAVLNVENQALTGGATVTSKDLGTQTTGTLTLDMGDRPLQHYTNGGAHTLAPGSVNGAALIDIVNNGSAGAITTSGWTNVVGSFTTTNTDAFRCHASVGNDGSLLIIQAMQ